MNENPSNYLYHLNKMDLASLSLGQIASMLSPRQQEVLLASISVAANFIQQIQHEEALNASGATSEKDDADLSENYEADDLSDKEEADDLSERDEDTPHNLTETSSRHHHPNHQPLSEKDEADLLTIRMFAEELKARRKSIRLSQKGAAQSLRAFTGGAQPCTDAIIYHFENLQLEPERAMQLIPLLKDWLDWAEKHRLTGKQLPMMSAVTKVPRERKRKVVLFNEKAKHYLEDAFAKNNHPDRYQLDVISHELDIPTRSIRKWFTNRRQRKRFAEKFLPANTSSTSISSQ